jgi:hypothetical protein
MAEPGAETVLPIREGEGEKKAAAEQEINPWDVQAAIDENGNALAFDYVAISQYAHQRIHLAVDQTSDADKTIGSGRQNSSTTKFSNDSNVLRVTNHTAG